MSILQAGISLRLKRHLDIFSSSALFKDAHRDVQLCVYRCLQVASCTFGTLYFYLSSLNLTRFGLQQVPNLCVNIVSRIV